VIYRYWFGLGIAIGIGIGFWGLIANPDADSDPDRFRIGAIFAAAQSRKAIARDWPPQAHPCVRATRLRHIHS
jgi:hypothetical protein